MNGHTLSKAEIVKQFIEGFDCSQVVLSQWAEDLGYGREEALRMAAAFGGGMFRGDTCGAVAGAMIAIGLRYGHSESGDKETKAILLEKVSEFQKRFTQRCGSTICRELCGFDFSKEGELQKAAESGRLIEDCPRFVQEALAVLDEIL